MATEGEDNPARCPMPAVGMARVCVDCQRWEAPSPLYGVPNAEALRDWDIMYERQKEWTQAHYQPIEDAYIERIKTKLWMMLAAC